MKFAIGSDHGGVNLKKLVAAHLLAHEHDVFDVGTHDTTSCDYPDIAHAVARMVAQGEVDRGVLICGTGIGMSITANKTPGVRAAVVSDTFSATMAAAHNHAQILCLGERVVGPGLAIACLDAWLQTPPEAGRHDRRVAKIEPA